NRGEVFEVAGGALAVQPGPPTASKEAAARTEAERWEGSVVGLPAEKQVEEVERRLRELNPGFEGKVKDCTIQRGVVEGGIVRGLGFSTDKVADISPLRALRGLESLNCSGDWPKEGKLSDLGPLRKLPLKILICGGNPITDLGPLQGVPLKDLRLGATHVSDLTPLKSMQLEILHLPSTRTADLSPLAGCKSLRELWVDFTPVSDLAPLRNLPLH